MKKSITFLCIVMLLAGMLSGSATANTPPRVFSQAAIVIDYDTGETLYEKDAHSWRSPASMSKVLTAFIVYEEIAAGRLSLDTNITISANVARITRDSNMQGSSVPMNAGDAYTVELLLRLMMLPSSNGACVAAAEHISGSEREFAELMNSTGERIGMSADFNNSHGALPNNPNFTTAHSMGVLVRTFIQLYPDILRITAMTTVNHNGTTRNQTNQLLRSEHFYTGADGFKTGTTREAGFCLASTAIYNGKRIIVVTMNGQNNDQRYGDSKALLNYGFAEAARRDAERAEAERIEAEERRAAAAALVNGVILDGVTLEFDVQPRRVNGRVMVPYRALIEALDADADMEWHGATREVTASFGNGDIIKLTIGSTTVYVNDEAFEVDVAPMLASGRTLVPLRFVAELFNFSVDWDNQERIVTITSAGEEQAE